MRDLAALLTSLVAVERQQLLAMLEAEKEQPSTGRARTSAHPKQRARGEEAARRAARLAAMLAYFREGAIEDLAAADNALCGTSNKSSAARCRFQAAI